MGSTERPNAPKPRTFFLFVYTIFTLCKNSALWSFGCRFSLSKNLKCPDQGDQTRFIYTFAWQVEFIPAHLRVESHIQKWIDKVTLQGDAVQKSNSAEYKPVLWIASWKSCVCPFLCVALQLCPHLFHLQRNNMEIKVTLQITNYLKKFWKLWGIPNIYNFFMLLQK